MNGDRRIDAYIATAQPFARQILEKARERVHAALSGAQETLKWNMPAYTLDGKLVLMTAAFKAHAALNFWRGQELETSHSAVGAMGQFGRIRSIEELPANDELDRLIREAAVLSTKRRGRARPSIHQKNRHPKCIPNLLPLSIGRRKRRPRWNPSRHRHSAIISNGSAKRNRMPRAKSASPLRSNGYWKASGGIGNNQNC